MLSVISVFLFCYVGELNGTLAEFDTCSGNQHLENVNLKGLEVKQAYIVVRLYSFALLFWCT